MEGDGSLKGTGSTGDLMRQVSALFGGGVSAGLADGELLERFQRRKTSGDFSGAEAAFGAIVDRHGKMVLNVCRRALSNPQDAEDAFQATFLVLARKAGSVRVDASNSIAPWLYGVTRKVAAKARRQSARRQAREVSVPGIEVAEPTSRFSAEELAERAELRALIMEEIDRLPGRFRQAIEAIDLDGCTQDEAARRLGWPVGTVRSRLSRGRARLRDRLTRRGIQAPSVIPIAGAPLVKAVPNGLAVSTIQAAVAFASKTALPGAISVPALTLAEGVLRMFTATKLISASMVFTIGTAIIAASAIPRPVQEKPAPDPEPIVEQKFEIELEPLEVQVLDSETGEPIEGATVIAKLWQVGRFPEIARDSTDAQGIANVARPSKAIDGFYLDANADGKVPMRASWLPEDLADEPPDTFTFELQTGETIGGIVQDERGQPIEGAKVYVWLFKRRDQEDGADWNTSTFPLTTNAEGRWSASYLPPEISKDTRILVRYEHPNFVGNSYGYNSDWELTIDQAQSLEAVHILADGVTIQGRVLDEAGQPVADARVIYVEDSNPSEIYEKKTDAEGRFQFHNVLLTTPPERGEPRFGQGLLPVTVEKAGFATTWVPVPLGQEAEPVEIVLQAPPAFGGSRR